MIIEFKSKYKKSYKKLSSKNQLLVDAALKEFIENPFTPSLKNHALKGEYAGLRSFSAAYDLRIIYKEEGGHIRIIMINVGTHAQVY